MRLIILFMWFDAGTMKDLTRKMISGEVPPPSVATTIGFRALSVGDGESVFEMDTDPARHANPMGTVHGGILCDLADAAMGMAWASKLEQGETFTTVELKINFFKPLWKAHLTARGKVIRWGRTIGLVECEITDDTGVMVAKAASTCLTLRGEKAAGR